MQRSSPSRTAGIVIRNVKLGGVEYTLSQPDRVRRAADEEAVVIGRRLDTVPALIRSCAQMPEDEKAQWRQDCISAMVCGIASPEEWRAYSRSLWLPAFRFWNALDPKHKIDEVTGREMTILEGVEWAYEVINNDAVSKGEMDSLWTAVRFVSQEDAVKNSSGPISELGTPKTAPPTTEDGQQSTPSS